MKIENIVPGEMKKILCIKPRGIGDIVLSTIILDNLKSYFEGVRIDYLTEDFAREAVEDNPMISKVLTMERTGFPLKVAWKIRKEKYNMILDLWSNPRSAQITFLSGVKYRVGYNYRGRRYAYNILATSERGAHHSAEHNLELLKAIGVPVVSKKIHFYLNNDDLSFGTEFVEKNFNNSITLIGIVPSGGWQSKRCDASKWVEICSALHNKLNTGFLILWGPGDEEDAEYIKSKLKNTAVMAPPTSVKQMSGLIKSCDLVIANDSGPMHISAALGVPTLGLFGPTNPLGHGPYSDNSDFVVRNDLFCINCNKQICPYRHECFADMPVQDIILKAEALLGNNRKTIGLNEKD